MLSTDQPFDAAYEAELADAPSDGAWDFSFTDGMAGSRGSTVTVTPFEGFPWTGWFAASDPVVARAVSGLFPTPDPTVLCVVERGTAFLVDVLNPARYQVVATHGPVVAVEPVREAAVLLLVTHWAITAIGAGSVAWTSARIAIEGIRVDEVADGWLRGVADPDDEEQRDFAIDLATGELIGGAGI